ncbi:hypothetical protein ABPG77_010076 [Micractinium sp. CCAP 211/92]
MDSLVRRLRSGSFALQIQALNTLVSACEGKPDTSRAAAAAGAIPVLVRLLRSSASTIQGLAASALHEMAEHAADLRPAMLAAGAVPPLVALLRSGNEAAQVCAVAALTELCYQSAQGTQAVTATGDVAAVVQLLESRSKEALTHTVSLLSSLSVRHCDELCAALAAAPTAIPRLFRLLAPGRLRDEDVQAGAAGVLGAAALGSRRLALACIEAGALPPLAELAQATHLGCRYNAAAALCGLASQSPALTAACPGVIPALVHVARSNVEASSLIHAAQSLRFLAADSSQRSQAIMQAGGADALQVLRRHPHPGVRGHAARALAQLTTAAELQAAAEVLAAVEAAAGSSERVKSRPRVCAAEGCVATKGLKLCARCGTVRYCSATADECAAAASL